MLNPSFLNVSCTCMIVWFPKTWENFWCLFGVFSIPLTWGSLHKNPKSQIRDLLKASQTIHIFSLFILLHLCLVLTFQKSCLSTCYSFFHLIKICWGNRQLILPSDFGSLTIPHTSLCMQIRICLLNAVNHLLTWSSNALAFKSNTLDSLLHQASSLTFLESVANFRWCVFSLHFYLLCGHLLPFPLTLCAEVPVRGLTHSRSSSLMAYCA